MQCLIVWMVVVCRGTFSWHQRGSVNNELHKFIKYQQITYCADPDIDLSMLLLIIKNTEHCSMSKTASKKDGGEGTAAI